MYVECPGIFFPSCPSEGIDGSSDPDIHKTGFLFDEHMDGTSREKMDNVGNLSPSRKI